jgi:hypothetical protein
MIFFLLIVLASEFAFSSFPYDSVSFKFMHLTNTSIRPGCGSDVLYRYSAATHGYAYLGQYLTGISNNPYINGIDFRLSRIHVSWCYRNFVEIPSTLETKHKQHAGPNGPENNKDFYYTYSDDLGETWKSSEGEVMAKLIGNGEDGAPSTIKADTKGAKVFDIPMGSGILNQEAQAPDWLGGFWALNRQRIDGNQTWMVYYRNPEGMLLMTWVCVPD